MTQQSLVSSVCATSQPRQIPLACRSGNRIGTRLAGNAIGVYRMPSKTIRLREDTSKPRFLYQSTKPGLDSNFSRPSYPVSTLSSAAARSKCTPTPRNCSVRSKRIQWRFCGDTKSSSTKSAGKPRSCSRWQATASVENHHRPTNGAVTRHDGQLPVSQDAPVAFDLQLGPIPVVVDFTFCARAVDFRVAPPGVAHAPFDQHVGQFHDLRIDANTSRNVIEDDRLWQRHAGGMITTAAIWNERSQPRRHGRSSASARPRG